MSVAATDDPVLVIERLHKCFIAGAGPCRARVRVLDGASLRVQRGEIIAIAGGAGAGKSTLLLCVAGLLRPDSGSVLVAGKGARDQRGSSILLTGASGARALRGLTVVPPIVLADGVLDSLDDCDRARVGERMERLAAGGAAVLLTTRDRAAVRHVATRVERLSLGAIGSDESRRTAAVRVAERALPTLR